MLFEADGPGLNSGGERFALRALVTGAFAIVAVVASAIVVILCSAVTFVGLWLRVCMGSLSLFSITLAGLHRLAVASQVARIFRPQASSLDSDFGVVRLAGTAFSLRILYSLCSF